MVNKKIIHYQPNNPHDGVTTHLKHGHVFQDTQYNQQALKQLLGANILIREENYHKTKDNNGNIVDHSIAWTQIDTMDKYTDYIQHCLWIAVLGDTKYSDELISGIIHVPACIVGHNHSHRQQIFLKTLKQYHKTLKTVSNNYQIFYGGGAIRPHHPIYNSNDDADEDDEALYRQGEKKLKYFINSYLKTSPIKITDPKGLGSELVHIKTQEEKISSYYPSFRG